MRNLLLLLLLLFNVEGLRPSTRDSYLSTRAALRSSVGFFSRKKDVLSQMRKAA